MLEEVGFETTWYEDRLEEEWDFHYRLLSEYVSIYGMEAVIEDTIYKDCKIGSWLHYQRGKYNTGSISQEKYKKLYDLGVPFNSAEQRWELLFSLACRYYQEFHNLDVPDGFIIEGEDLGRWISYQREKYNRHDNSISDEKISRLESIGMRWAICKGGSSSFAEQAVFYYLRMYFPDAINRDTSHEFELDNYIPSLKVAIEYDGEYWHRNKRNQDDDKDDKCTALGKRLIRIREYPLSDTKSAECYCTKGKYSRAVIEDAIRTIFKKQFLLSVDVDIARDAFGIITEYQRNSSKSWYSFFLAAKEYYEGYGNLLIPARYVTKDGKKLGSWIQNQRQAYKGQTTQYLSDSEIKLLESIDMVWDVREKNWEKAYTLAKEYYEEYGTINVPRDCIYKGFNIGGVGYNTASCFSWNKKKSKNVRGKKK